MSTVNHTCVYINCKNTLKNRRDLAYFKFPIKDLSRCEEWKKNCGNIRIAVADNKDLSHKLICEKHFLASDIMCNPVRKYLIKSAIPIKYSVPIKSTSETTPCFPGTSGIKIDILKTYPAQKRRLSTDSSSSSCKSTDIIMPKAPTYSSTTAERALRELQKGQGSLRRIAKKYGVPRATLQFKLKNPERKSTFGPSPVLTENEEKTIVGWITDLAKKGFPRKKYDIISSVQQFLEKHPRPNPFTDNRPGEGWMRAFLKRHPDVVSCSTEAIALASASVSEKDIRKWFADIYKYIEEKELEDVLQDPSRIFNGDETIFQICPNTGKVLVPKGRAKQGSSKENITVMFTFAADGKTCNPMVVFPYKRIPEKISMTVPEDWRIGRSDNGWMTAETFYEYIVNVFHPYLLKEGIRLPVILFIDGHKSHITYQLSMLCSELNIELIALYPNATRILQPADVAVFRPVKMHWQKVVREWSAEHPGETITKLTFTPLLEKVVRISVKPETLHNGFKACGLYPFDSNAIDYSRCLGAFEKEPDEHTGDNNNFNNVNVRMDYATFVNIVGKEKVALFQQIQAVTDNDDENFFLLYKLWKHFNNHKLDSEDAQSETEVVTSIKDEIETQEEDFEDYIQCKDEILTP